MPFLFCFTFSFGVNVAFYEVLETLAFEL